MKLKIKVSHASTKIVAEFVGEAPRFVQKGNEEVKTPSCFAGTN